MIRYANHDDVPRMVELSEAKRAAYEAFQPWFWRRSSDSQLHQARFFRSLLDDSRIIALTHESSGAIKGFLIARLVQAPPVYDPGGLTCMIDDFCVDGPAWQESGRALLEAAVKEARTRGAVQAVVVCGHLDAPKKEFLKEQGFSIASEWHIRAI